MYVTKAKDLYLLFWVAGYGIAFSVDLERNPMNVGSDYAVTMKLDPLELLYNQVMPLKLFCVFRFYF